MKDRKKLMGKDSQLIIKSKIEIKRRTRILLNEVRRLIVNKLLGNDLVLQEIKNGQESKVRFIDMKRRLPYCWWKAVRIDDKETKLSR